jgi:hypothetical protein
VSRPVFGLSDIRQSSEDHSESLKLRTLRKSSRYTCFSVLEGALTLASLSCLGGCGITAPPNIRPQQANVAALRPQDWYIYYSAGMPSHPSADPLGAWSFEFPSAELAGHVNYIQTPFNATTTPHNVTITFKIESDIPQYKVIDSGDTLPATIHLFFEQQNDDLVDPNGRWWAGASAYNLASLDNTTITLVVPLTPDQWSNVDGQRDPRSFYAALGNVGWIRVTCGGQYFWGHGVALAGGRAKYTLINLNIN